MRLIRISPIVYHFSGGMSVNSKMHLILDFCEKILIPFYYPPLATRFSSACASSKPRWV